MGSASIEEVASFADSQNWSQDARIRAYALATRPVEVSEWKQFLHRNLLAGGSLALLSGASCFVAANWSLLGAYAKFILLDVLLLLLALSAWRTGLQDLKARWALTVSCGLVGAVLALYSQTYPSDAESYLLPLTWAGLILPWTLLLRFEPAWLLWVGVANTALSLATEEATITGFVNLLFWGLAVRFSPRLGWPQMPLTVCWFALTGAGLWAVLDSEEGASLLAWLVWFVLTATYAYRRRHKGTLAAVGFSAIILITGALLRSFAQWNDTSWLFILGVAVTVQVSLLIAFLRRLPE